MWYSRSCFQFHCQCYAVNAQFGSLVIVSPEPRCCLVLYLLNCFKDVLAQPFAAKGAIVTLVICVLLRFSRLNMFEANAVLFSPYHQCPTDIFWAVVDTYGLRFVAPFYDLVQAAHNPSSGQREVNLDAQAFSIKVIQHVQCSDRSAIRKLVGDLFVLIAQNGAISKVRLADLKGAAGQHGAKPMLCDHVHGHLSPLKRP